MEVRNESGGLIVLSETDGTEYTFTTDNPDPCDLYSFTVTPSCGMKEGTSAVVNGTFLAGKQDQLACLLHNFFSFFPHAVSTVGTLEDSIIKTKSMDQVSFVVLFEIMVGCSFNVQVVSKALFLFVQFLDEETLCPGRMGQRVSVKIQGALVITISVSSLEAEMSDNTTSRQLNISDYEFPDNQFLTASIILQNDVVTSNTVELEFSK